MSLIAREIAEQLELRFGIIGESQPMAQAMSRLVQVAPTDLTVLLTGETGTGKEVFAQALHSLSPRKRQPFVSVNCGAIPETLLESELFGAEKGAYTGADERRKGFFESAHLGTIFLDEIGEMPVGTQVKLLRILESGEFSRLGSSTVQRVDVRVITATNRDLFFEVKQGRFRQDLFFRLNSVNIHLPPLRQHTMDIPLLVDYFARRTAQKNGSTYQGIDEGALALLAEQAWPGNVRELRNLIETVVTLERGSRITPQLLAPYLTSNTEPPTNTMALARIGDVRITPELGDSAMLYRSVLQLTAEVSEMKSVLRHLLNMTYDPQAVTPQNGHVQAEPLPDIIDAEDLNLERIERVAIQRALKKTAGRRREAAQILGISERTLYRKIDEYNLD